MTPLRYVVLGLVVVMVDVRVGGFDVASDPVGWALAALGTGRLAARYPHFEAPRNAALVGLVVSLPLAVVSLRPLPGLAVEDALEVALVFTLCSALAQVVQDPSAASVFRTARWYDLGLTAAALLSVAARLTVPAVLLVLADVLVVAWAALAMWRVSEDAELLAR